MTDVNVLSAQVGDAIRFSLTADEKTRDPINALVVWTELGRALAGTLERKGASLGLLRELALRTLREQGARNGEALEAWIYRIEPEQRLDRKEMAQALRRAHEAIEKAAAELLHESTAGEMTREVFLTIVKGWWAVGPWIAKCLQAARKSSREEALGMLAAWCARYLPVDPAGPSDLGVRVDKGHERAEKPGACDASERRSQDPATRAGGGARTLRRERAEEP